ncbi:hypothetical protein B0H13DRAFT_1936738 [Mycena leptocephala]|nr:hypothetical protein B0H13DRAFT_1936738 [Mycena leptocephala]
MRPLRLLNSLALCLKGHFDPLGTDRPAARLLIRFTRLGKLTGFCELLYTGDNPLSRIAHTDFIKLVFRLGVRPEHPDNNDIPKLSDILWTLAEQFWLQHPKAQPSAGQVHDLVVDAISQLAERQPVVKDDEPEQDPQLLSELNLSLLENRLILGDDHPKSLKIIAELFHTYTQCGLTMTYHSLRQFKEAEELGLVVVEKRKTVLGEDHSQTLRAMSNLAQTYNKLGKLTKAEELGTVVMKRCTKSWETTTPTHCWP